MAGHSRWANIKRKKAAIDAVRGKIFTKLIKEITVAARMGGGNLDGNPRLRLSVDKARGANVPSDSIQRAIKKGTGELEGVNYEEIIYEGYGPGGAAVMIEAMTDNKHRTAPELKKIFSDVGGSLAATNSVAWQFQKKGYLVVEKGALSGDQMMELALELGADDLKDEGKECEIFTDVASFLGVKSGIEGKKIKILSADLAYVPQNTVKLTGEKAKEMLELMDELENHDDVQNVYANFDIDEAELG